MPFVAGFGYILVVVEDDFPDWGIEMGITFESTLYS
jgi:hypothetical protein